MRLLLTGCNGSVGNALLTCALRRGHTVLGADITPQSRYDPGFIFVQTDLRDYQAVLSLMAQDIDAVVHLAACRNPGDYAVNTHHTNVTMSWNVLRAAAEIGVARVAQASTVNVIPMVYSKTARYDYFPIDEDHPCCPDEPYGLSKVICEIQADTICRRYETMRVASLRLHWSLPDRTQAEERPIEGAIKDLFGYVQEDSAAEAFLLAVEERDNVSWQGHERFFIVSPVIAYQEDWYAVKNRYFANVPVREGSWQSFFNCSKARRMLGWVHRDRQHSA